MDAAGKEQNMIFLALWIQSVLPATGGVSAFLLLGVGAAFVVVGRYLRRRG